MHYISIVVYCTFLYGLFQLKFKNKNHIVLLLILLTCSLTELLASASDNISVLYSFSFTLHNSLWLYLLGSIANHQPKMNITILLYILCSGINFLFFEKYKVNFLTFLIGAIFFLIALCSVCIKNLKTENLTFFSNNEFLIVIAPVLFFIGFSFMFAFRNSDVRFIKLFGKFDLYQCISTFVNVIYYSFINIYIFKERKINA